MLCATCCFQIAAKFEEIYAPEYKDYLFLTTSVKIEIARFIEMEKWMLEKLNYRLCLPNACQFIRRFSKVTYANDKQHFMTKYLIELALLHSEWLQYLPSMWSAAAVLLTHLLIDNEDVKMSVWVKNLTKHSRYTLNNLSICVTFMQQWFRDAKLGLREHPFKGYAAPNKHSVAMLHIPSEEQLKQRINQIQQMILE